MFCRQFQRCVSVTMMRYWTPSDLRERFLTGNDPMTLRQLSSTMHWSCYGSYLNGMKSNKRSFTHHGFQDLSGHQLYPWLRFADARAATASTIWCNHPMPSSDHLLCSDGQRCFSFLVFRIFEISLPISVVALAHTSGNCSVFVCACELEVAFIMQDHIILHNYWHYWPLMVILITNYHLLPK